MIYLTVLKRLLGARMSKEDLYKCVDGLLSDYSWMEKYGKTWIKDYLINNRDTNGRTFDETWRGELDAAIGLIATEPTWALQRKKLLQLRVSANDWVALDRVVSRSYRNDVDIWADCVITNLNFVGASEKFYPAMLTLFGVFNLLNSSILTGIGAVAFGLTDSDTDKATFYRDLKVNSLEKKFGLFKGLKTLTEENSEIGMTVIRTLRSHLEPHEKEEAKLFRQLADEIASRHSLDTFPEKYEKWADAYNQTLEASKADMFASQDVAAPSI